MTNKKDKETKSIYNPKFPIGTKIYYTNCWGDKVKELKVVSIVFTEEENRSFYRYYLNSMYSFEEIEDGFGVGSESFLKMDYYYPTREEAEKARKEILRRIEINRQKIIEENYKRAKEEYEKLIKSSKIK